jgi:hypothetical protein
MPRHVHGMTQPGEAINGEPLSRRLHVADAAGETIAVATLNVADGKLSVQLHGEERAKELAPHLEALKFRRDDGQVAEDGEPSNGVDIARFESAVRQLSEALAAVGYMVTPLPVGDVQLNSILDIRSGRAFTTCSPLTPLAKDAPDIAQKLNAAIAGMPARFCREVVSEITTPLVSGDHIGAATALCEAANAGRLAFANASVLEAARRIDVAALSRETEKQVRLIRAGLGALLQKYSVTEEDTNALLARDDLDLEERSNLQIDQGIILLERGAKQAAITLWRKVAKDSATPPGVRAWAWRNLSFSLAPGCKEAIQPARASADAFLEAGEKREAVGSLLQLFAILEHHDRRAAAQELDSLHGLINAPDLWGRVEQAALHHALGNRFAAMRQHERALAEAKAAIMLRRGMAGAEEELISSLHLAAMEAQALKLPPEAEAFQAEAEALTSSTGSLHFQIATRIKKMLRSFSKAHVQLLRMGAEKVQLVALGRIEGQDKPGAVIEALGGLVKFEGCLFGPILPLLDMIHTGL